MKDYSSFEASDFVLDEYFVRWVRHQEPEATLFWNDFLKAHPEKRVEVDEARRIIEAVLIESQRFPSAHEKAVMWSRISVASRPEQRRRLFVPVWTKVAALLLLVGVLSYALHVYQQEPDAVVDKTVVTALPEFSERVNNADKPLTMLLSDGSSIVLQPNSSLRYPQNFNGELREVHLEGEALFDIAKDPKRPFLVYANELVTRVLGTSFTVRAYESEPEVIVEVRSGKVSVFSQDKGDNKISTADKNQRKEGLVLTPNQQAVYTRSEDKLVKSLFDNPTLLSEPAKSAHFEFVDARMEDVFNQLEKSYGVSIVYDDEVMNNCFLNASLGEETLEVKLNLICKAVNATYEIMDTHVIVYGKGCNE